MPVWQPIETAPRDGESVLLCGPAYRFGRQVGKYVCAGMYSGGNWIEREDAEDALFPPTHWMSLPPLPI